LACLAFKSSAPIRKVMRHVDSQMAALASVNQVLKIPAFRITFAEVRSCEHDEAASELRRSPVYFCASPRPAGKAMQAALTGAFAAISRSIANARNNFAFPISRIVFWIKTHRTFQTIEFLNPTPARFSPESMMMFLFTSGRKRGLTVTSDKSR
jgi:hypothetical protein